MAEFRDVEAELSASIQAIQEIPGYQDFFGRPTLEQLQETLAWKGQAADGPLVAIYLLSTERESLALIVGAHGVVPVWLQLTEAELKGLLVECEGGRVTGGYLLGQLGVVDLRPELDKVLKVVGAKAVGPIVKALSQINAEEKGGGRRIVLIPSGPLALVPLHAAVYASDGGERTLLDDAVVSYAPSLRVLAHCQKAAAALLRQEATLVAFGNPLPLPEHMAPLAFARAEVEEISRLFGDHATAWYEDQATLEILERHLNFGSHLHLSCHGRFEPRDPLASAVILGGGEMLTLKDLIDRHRLTQVRLAVLSACQTAVTDFLDLPEESLGLAADSYTRACRALSVRSGLSTTSRRRC